MQVTAQTPASGVARSAKNSQSVDLSASNFVSSTVQADATVKNAILNLLSGDSKLQSTFESSFFAEMQKAADMKLRITNENGMHNALVSVIMQNRSQFPGGSFTLKTELPGGGSIETVIPVAGQDAASVSPVPDQSSVKLSALLNTTNVDSDSGIPARLAADAYLSI
ncbi:hypothetical protein [Neorhizobium tomejilense]|uniref:hypothetical protein n=1 Tax=Neorhizobium tomejilense TaxID=2093828 RepID=UPI000CF98DE4|nr:hypothetical protein [Neorhizobium tomejilense]